VEKPELHTFSRRDRWNPETKGNSVEDNFEHGALEDKETGEGRLESLVETGDGSHGGKDRERLGFELHLVQESGDLLGELGRQASGFDRLAEGSQSVPRAAG